MQDRTSDGDAPRGISPHDAIDERHEIGRLAQEIKRLSEQLLRESQRGSQQFRAPGYRWLPRGA